MGVVGEGSFEEWGYGKNLDPRYEPTHPEDRPDTAPIQFENPEVWDTIIQVYLRDLAEHDDYWAQHGGDKAKHDFLWGEWAEQYAKNYETYLRQKAEERERNKKTQDEDEQEEGDGSGDDERKRKKPSGGMENPDDPDGPSGPWVRERGAYGGAAPYLPNPEDPGGTGPIGPWARGGYRPGVNSRAMPNPDDGHGPGPIGPQIRQRVGSIWLYPAPDDPNPGGPAGRGRRSRGR